MNCSHRHPCLHVESHSSVGKIPLLPLFGEALLSGFALTKVWTHCIWLLAFPSYPQLLPNHSVSAPLSGGVCGGGDQHNLSFRYTTIHLIKTSLFPLRLHFAKLLQSPFLLLGVVSYLHFRSWFFTPVSTSAPVIYGPLNSKLAQTEGQTDRQQ